MAQSPPYCQLLVIVQVLFCLFSEISYENRSSSGSEIRVRGILKDRQPAAHRRTVRIRAVRRAWRGSAAWRPCCGSRAFDRLDLLRQGGVSFVEAKRVTLVLHRAVVEASTIRPESVADGLADYLEETPTGLKAPRLRVPNRPLAQFSLGGLPVRMAMPLSERRAGF